ELAAIGNVDVGHAVFECGAGIAGCDEHPGNARRLRELPCQRILAAAAAHDEEFHQCRKWRWPVKTIATPRASAAAITSSSRRLPPGWITAAAPASAMRSSPSRNGKNASDATTEPASDRFAFFALIAAMRAESTRLIWPAPMPSVCPRLQNTMALDLTYLTTRQANNRSSRCCAV